MNKCLYCGQDIELVAQNHEENWHNIQCSLRHDIVPDDKMCEDCRDDVLENM